MQVDKKMADEIIAIEEEKELRMSPMDEFEQWKPTEDERFLVVGSLSMFASTDVWDGICGALRDEHIIVLPYAMNKLRAFFSVNMLLKDILATAIDARNRFSHVLFVGASFIPSWLIYSIQRAGVRVIYWSLEDPHALDQNIQFLDIANYYFTNEKKVAEKFKKAHYIPTAGNQYACMPPKEPIDKLEDKFKDAFSNDIIFCGNIYPNRQEILEALIPHIKKKSYRFGLIGITSLMENKEKSPLKNYFIEFKTEHGERLEGVIDHRMLVMMYGYSKIVLNLERESLYEYNEKYSTNRKHKIIGESLNPRAYEISLCGGGIQLIDRQRKELYSGNSIQPRKHCDDFEGVDELCKKIDFYMTHEKERVKITKAAREYVLMNHTYRSRLKRMLRIIRIKEGRKKEELAKGLIEDIARTGLKKVEDHKAPQSKA